MEYDNINEKGQGQLMEHRPTDLSVEEISAKVGINRRLVLLTIWATFGAISYGFSAAVISSSLGQPNLYAYFPELVTGSNSTQVIGAIVASFNIGGAVGVFLVSWVSKRYGRKMAFLVSALFAFLGAGLGAGAVSVTMLAFGRLFSGIGAWGAMLAAITYGNEIAPANIRGLIGGAIGASLMFGYTIAGWLGVGFYFVSSTFNWRAVLILQIIAPLLSCLGLPWVPESPRFLVKSGQIDKALATLRYLHKSSKDPDYIIAKEEHFQIQKQDVLDKTLGGSWLDMFGRYRKRTLCGMLVVVANQFTGANLIANYGTTLYANLGYAPEQSLMFQAGWFMTGTALALFAGWVVDRVGRVKLLVYSCCAASLFLCIETALLAQTEGGNTSTTLQSAAVSIQFLWYLGYAFGEPVQFLYIGEIYPTHVREKGIALALCALNLMAVWVTMAQPTANAAIGWKFWLIFIIASFSLGVLQWFVLPETKLVPLEEIAGLFGEEDEVAVVAQQIKVDSSGNVILAKGKEQV